MDGVIFPLFLVESPLLGVSSSNRFFFLILWLNLDTLQPHEKRAERDAPTLGVSTHRTDYEQLYQMERKKGGRK
jgi:hypothetical protein